MKSNKELKEIYNKQYKEGYINNHTFDSYEESKAILDNEDWRDKEVLEIGCGEGNLANMIITAKAKKVDAYDYSEEAIRLCKNKYNIQGLTFYCEEYKKTKEKYDIVVLQGVLEHIDKPFEELDYIITNLLKEDGLVITSSPSFLNLRGYVWMTLYLLFDAPMSLSDIHYFNISDFEKYCKENNYELDYDSCNEDWGTGDGLILDYDKRIRSVLKDMGLYNEKKVDKFIEWLQEAKRFVPFSYTSGANMIYRIKK